MTIIDLAKSYLKGEIDIEDAISSHYNYFFSTPTFCLAEVENLLAFCRLLFDYGRFNQNRGKFNDAMRCYENVSRTFEHNQSLHKNILSDNLIYEQTLLEQAHILHLANRDRKALLILNKLVRLHPLNLEYLNAQKKLISSLLCKWVYVVFGISLVTWVILIIEYWTQTDFLPRICNDIASIGWIIGLVVLWFMPSVVQKYINRKK